MFIVISGVLAWGLWPHEKKVLINKLEGEYTPSFTLPNLLALDKKVSTDQFKGQVTVVNFWADWCFECKREMPILNQFTKLPQVKLYGINFRDDYNSALGLLKRFGNPYRANAFDKDGVTGIDFGISGLPETFILDKKGKIVYRHIGPLTEGSAQKLLQIIARYNQMN